MLWIELLVGCRQVVLIYTHLVCIPYNKRQVVREVCFSENIEKESRDI